MTTYRIRVCTGPRYQAVDSRILEVEALTAPGARQKAERELTEGEFIPAGEQYCREVGRPMGDPNFRLPADHARNVALAGDAARRAAREAQEAQAR